MIIDLDCMGGIVTKDMKYFRKKWKKEFWEIEKAYGFYHVHHSGYFENIESQTYSKITRRLVSSIILRFTSLKLPSQTMDMVEKMKQYYAV